MYTQKKWGYNFVFTTIIYLTALQLHMKLVFPVLDDTPYAGCTAPSLLTPLLKVHCNIQHLNSSGVGNLLLHYILKTSPIVGHAVTLLDQICSYKFNTAKKSDVKTLLVIAANYADVSV
jgi:hypothetical protein